MADDLNQNEISSSNLPEQMEDDLEMEIRAMINGAKDILPPTCCIYRVPRSVREGNEYIYTPTTISIGPFHCCDSRLKNMERYKVMMLKRLLKRFTVRLNELISFVRSLEPKVSASYSEDTNLTGNEFQKLMLLDGAFIIELFLTISDGTELDPIMRQPKLLSDIRKDLILLENQLPFFFLEELYNNYAPSPCGLADRVRSFIELSFMFFKSFNIQLLGPNSLVNYNDGARLHHFTDLLRLFYLPNHKLTGRVYPLFSSSIGPQDILLYSAKQLAEFGIRLNASTRSCPLDLSLSANVLDMPSLSVDNDTIILFHNMIAFEQFQYSNENYICDYALLLDCLIDSQEDVNVLIRNGIIQNFVGDPSDIVRIFDGLSTNLELQSINYMFANICRRLNHYCSDTWRQIKPALKRQLLLSITGFVLNMLTLIQTIFSILQVVWR